MNDVQIRLSMIWVALMLSYLLGDVIRIFAGSYKAGELSGMKATQVHWLFIAVLMVLPIIMIVLTIQLKQPVNRWVNIIVAAFFFIFNIIGLPTYPDVFDKFLNVVGLVFNGLTVWTAWNWT